MCLSVCRSGHRDAKHIHYRVVWFHPRTLAWAIPRLCTLIVGCLCFPVDDDVVPSFFPLQDSSGLLAPSVTSFPSHLSYLPICPLSARFCVFSCPPPVSGPPHHPSVRELPTLRLRPTNVLFCFPDPASHMQVCTPPRPVRLVVLGYVSESRLVEIRRVDICCEVYMMSSHLSLPHERHLKKLFHIFAYLRNYH